MRYNRKFIEARFAMAMDAIGAPHGETWKDGKANVGIHFLDHAPIYGGYRICRMDSEGGGETTPFGSGRYSPTEFVAMLDGILGAARIMRGPSLIVKAASLRFRDIMVGETFDFISGGSRDSYFEPCVKISQRRYRAIKGGDAMSVGSIDCVVYHVGQHKAGA